jgi:hypothetical protein
MNPLMGRALTHPEEASLDDLQGIGLQVDQDTPQALRRGWQWTVPVGGGPPGHTRLPIKAPFSQMSLERGRKGRHQRLKLLSGQAGQIAQFGRASLKIGEPSRAHGCGLLIIGGIGYHKSR